MRYLLVMLLLVGGCAPYVDEISERNKRSFYEELERASQYEPPTNEELHRETSEYAEWADESMRKLRGDTIYPSPYDTPSFSCVSSTSPDGGLTAITCF